MFRIFEKLGGTDKAFDAIERRRGRRPTRRTLKLWRFNGNLPALAVMALMEECRERGIPFDPDDCRVQKDDRVSA